MKPTPKPWTFARLIGPDGHPLRGEAAEAYAADCIRAGGDQDFYAVLALAPDGGTVDVCHTGNGPTSEQNAMFIAAMPKLLERCEAFVARSLDNAGDAVADWYEEGRQLQKDLKVALGDS